MEALEILDVLEDAVSGGVSVPFSGRCMLDKEELLDLIQEVRLNLPNDLKQAKWVKEERQRILDEAKQEAEDIIKDAKEKIISLIDENEITRQSTEQAKKIIEDAKQKQAEVRQSSFVYTDGLLEYVENSIAKAMSEIEACAKEVSKNRKQLSSN
ncbi:MAG: ATPase [Oscillospiraceae bacterium]|nr:ATPase [Oscillospiraceae bacterium]